MAIEYLYIKKDNENGIIALSKSCFQTIARIAIDEDENIALATNNGIFKDALNCKIVNNQLIMNINVKIKYNTNVNQTCARVQGKIFENIKQMCGYQIDVIDIRVVGFIF